MTIRELLALPVQTGAEAYRRGLITEEDLEAICASALGAAQEMGIDLPLPPEIQKPAAGEH